jgi:1-acyl-sn-glycerol-3-phosphate acyltransferase
LHILRLTGIVLTAIVIAILTLIVSPFDIKGKMVFGLSKIFSKSILLSAGVKIECNGKERINKKEPYLFISNHMSYFDIPILMQALPSNIRFVYKKSMNKIPIFGWAMYLGKYIPIDRKNARNALKSLKDASRLIKKNISVVMFPEGTRSPDGVIHDFKKGMTIISEETKCRLVPVTVIGSFNILPKNTLRIKPGKVKVIIDEPVEFTKDKSLLDNLRNTIVTNFIKYK